MRNIYLIAFFSLAFTTTAQANNDTLVFVHGQMLKATDSTHIVGNILYEKLPYYDDIGMASTKMDGGYEIQLIKGEAYNFFVTKSRFKKYTQKFQANGNQLFNIHVEENIIELRKPESLIFTRGSDQISPGSYQELNELAIWMIENPAIIIQLEGHTDFAGNPDANMRLSQDRSDEAKTLNRRGEVRVIRN